MRSNLLLTRPLLAVLLLAPWVWIGCDEGGGTRVANLRPRVEITGGPLEGSVDTYTATIFWKGWDEDGEIDHFEYAIDPPIGFTTEEIMDPEGLGLTIGVIPGPEEGVDTLEVSKIDDDTGERISFRWVQTPRFSHQFVFETPNADSVLLAGRNQPVRTYSGAHVVYVRAQDNEGAYSEFRDLTAEDPPFRLGFTARTITPTSRIVSPNIEGLSDNRSALQVNSTVTVRWDGDDSDSPEASKKPKSYLYKLLELTALSPPRTVLNAIDPNILYTASNEEDSCWCGIPADTALATTLRLGTSGHFMFGVRARDLVGGTEPILDFGRNVFKFQVLPNAGRPALVVSEPSVGSFTCTAQNNRGEAVVDRPLRFTWSASAESYGGTIDGYSWGIDIPDLEVEGPNSGWSGWSQATGNFRPLLFRKPGLHVLYVRARDTAGVITLCTIQIDVVEFTFSRDLLVMDDYPDKNFPKDSQHDAFWDEMVTNSGRFQPGEWDVHAAFGDPPPGRIDGDTRTSPDELTLEEMGRYRLIIWSNDAAGFNGVSHLLNSSAKRPRLGAYLASGGKLWLNGRMTVAGTLLAGNNVNAELTYPKELRVGNFAWDFLKIQSTRVENDKAVSGNETFVRAISFNVLSPRFPEIYPTMDIDPGKLNPVQARRGGVTHVDAVFDPIFSEAEATFAGDIDTVYAYGAAGPIMFNRSALFHRRICAIRWADTSPSRKQGRIQWFGFPFYYIENSIAQETFNKTIDWFNEETLATP